MLRYYKNMLFFVKNSFVYRGWGEDRDDTVIEQPYPIIQESKETSDWKESTLFAWRKLPWSIKQSDYKVYLKEYSWKSDIKISRWVFSNDVVIKWIPKWNEQPVIDEVMKLDLSVIAGKELLWDETKGKLEWTREDYESNKPIMIEDLREQEVFFNWLLGDSDLSLSELDSINYNKLEKVLRQSFSTNYKKDDTFIKNRSDLINSIDKVIAEYHKRLRQQDPNFNNHSRFEQFIRYKENITNSIISDWKNFIDSVEKLSLAELLDTYKKAWTDDWKRYTLLQKIVDKHITWKWNSLAFWLNWEIVIKTLDENQKQVDAKDQDSINILNTVSQSDLKSDVLRNIISDSWLDITKDNPDYQILIPKILDKYNIKDDSDWVFVFHDIFRRKDELIKTIQDKLKNNNDLKVARDLNFVLDYINNQQSYPKEILEKATEISVLRKSWYDPTTSEWMNRIEKALKNWNAVNTILNDIRSANWWLVWAAIIIGSIIWLFMWWKWRTAALWSLWIQILWPGIEQLAHKWGLAEYIMSDMEKWKPWETGSTIAWLENPFKSVDVTIKNLPKKYEDVYWDMYKKNTSWEADKMIFPQDYAQIFSCLVQKQDVRKMDLNAVKTKLANWDSPNDILWDANIPKKYIKWILQSKWKDKIIDDDRNISSEDLKLFLELLVSQAEPLDKTLWDVFVKWQETPTEYLDNKVYGIENTAISTEMDKISFSSPARTKLDEIVWRTNEIFSVENAVAKFDNTKRKEQIQWIITELENLKATNPSISTNIDTIITQYNNVLELLNLDSKIVDYKAKAFKGGDLFPWMEYIKNAANIWISWISAVVWYAKIWQGITLDKLQKLDPSEIDTLVAEWKTLLTQAWVSELQKTEINAIILKLKEKKLTLLRSKDRLNPTQNWKMSTETQTVFADLIESNSAEYTKKINWVNLINKPTSETIWEYSSLLAKNYEWIMFLQSIIDIDDSMLWTEWAKMKAAAKIKIDSYNDKWTWFEANLKVYIAWKQKELVDINNSLSSATIDTIKMSWTEFQKIKAEFTKEWIVVDSLNKLWETFGIEALTTTWNSIADFEAYYNQILWTPIDLGSSVFKTKLDEVEMTISNRITELIEIQPQPVLPTDISNQQELDIFMNETENYKKKLNEFSLDNKDLVDAKLDIINWIIWELEIMFVNWLNDNISDNTKLANKWKSIKEYLKYDWDNFEKSYNFKLEEIGENKFNEWLKLMTEVPENIKWDLIELININPELKSILQWSNNVFEIIKKLDDAIKQYELGIQSNPDFKTKIEDINNTLELIIAKLKWYYIKAEWYEVSNFWKKTTRQILNYFTK